MEKKMIVHSLDRTSKELLNVPNYVPFDLLSEEWAKINHSQTLTRLNERGGLGVIEILNNIDKKHLEFRGATQQEVDRLNEIIEHHHNPN